MLISLFRNTISQGFNKFRKRGVVFHLFQLHGLSGHLGSRDMSSFVFQLHGLSGHHGSRDMSSFVFQLHGLSGHHGSRDMSSFVFQLHGISGHLGSRDMSSLFPRFMTSVGATEASFLSSALTTAAGTLFFVFV